MLSRRRGPGSPGVWADGPGGSTGSRQARERSSAAFQHRPLAAECRVVLQREEYSYMYPHVGSPEAARPQAQGVGTRPDAAQQLSGQRGQSGAATSFPTLPGHCSSAALHRPASIPSLIGAWAAEELTGGPPCDAMQGAARRCDAMPWRGVASKWHGIRCRRPRRCARGTCTWAEAGAAYSYLGGRRRARAGREHLHQNACLLLHRGTGTGPSTPAAPPGWAAVRKEARPAVDAGARLDLRLPGTSAALLPGRGALYSYMVAGPAPGQAVRACVPASRRGAARLAGLVLPVRSFPFRSMARAGLKPTLFPPPLAIPSPARPPPSRRPRVSRCRSLELRELLRAAPIPSVVLLAAPTRPAAAPALASMLRRRRRRS